LNRNSPSLSLDNTGDNNNSRDRTPTKAFNNDNNNFNSFRNQTIDRSNNSKLKTVKSSLSENRRDNNRSTSPLLNNEYDNNCRSFGIWLNNNDITIDNALYEKYILQIKWIEINNNQLYTDLFKKLLNPISSVIDSDGVLTSSKEAFQTLKIDYAIRRFEIEQATMYIKICEVCSKSEVMAGIFMESLQRGAKLEMRGRKFIYRLKMLSNCSSNSIQADSINYH